MSAAAAVAAQGHNNPPPLKEVLAENYRHFGAEVDDLADRANRAPKTVRTEGDLDAVGLIVKDGRAMAKRFDAARKAEKEPHLQAGRDVDAFFKLMGARLDRIVTALEDRASEYQRARAAEARRKAEEEARKAREREEAERQKATDAEAAGRAGTAARAEGRAEAAAARAEEAERAADASAADLTRTRGASGTVASARTDKRVRITDMAALNLGPLGPYIDRDAIQKAANAWLRVTKGQDTMPGLEIYDDVRATFR